MNITTSYSVNKLFPSPSAPTEIKLTVADLKTSQPGFYLFTFIYKEYYIILKVNWFTNINKFIQTVLGKEKEFILTIHDTKKNSEYATNFYLSLFNKFDIEDIQEQIKQTKQSFNELISLTEIDSNLSLVQQCIQIEEIEILKNLIYTKPMNPKMNTTHSINNETFHEIQEKYKPLKIHVTEITPYQNLHDNFFSSFHNNYNYYGACYVVPLFLHKDVMNDLQDYCSLICNKKYDAILDICLLLEKVNSLL